MTATTNWGFTLLEIGQKDKSNTINTNMSLLDNAPKFLGDLSADPTTTNVPKGSTYFNTGTSRLKVLRGNNTWVNS